MTRFMQRGAAAVAAMTLLGSAVAVGVPGAVTAADGPLGSAPEVAAGSCWEIKQISPSSADGVYWLVTSKMPAPQQFYCDMTTDGGGWVLVGKGRNGWTEDQAGTGSPAQLTNTAYTGFEGTHQYSAERIDQLLNGAPVSGLTDSIRLRRATNTAGSTWQEVRFKTSLVGAGLWTWAFNGGLPLQTYGFDGSNTPTTSRTSNFGNDNTWRRVDTRREDRTGWDMGFAFGSSVTGTTDSTSYLYDGGTAGYAQPFTLMYLRPRVTSTSGFTAIPDTGTAAFERRLLPQSSVDPLPWGVTGIAGNDSREGNVEVQTLLEANGRMYVGGNFRWVQRDAGGTGRVEQPFLAAFDVNTGEWLQSFRPQLNEQVRALEVLSNGSIVAAGDFSAANGQPVTAIVALNPVTGATDTSFRLTVENRVASGVLRIEDLSANGNLLYIGGSFTHLRGGTRAAFAYMRNLARVSRVDGTTNTGWNPELNGAVMSVDAAADSTRAYAAGFFGKSKTVTALKAAAIETAAGAALATPAWAPQWSTTSGDNNYQRAIQSRGEQVWVGGSEHSLFSFSTSTFEREYTTIMDSKGDLQAIEIDANDVTFGGCHCNWFSYEGATRWPSPTGWFAVYSMGWMGAWDNTTGQRLPGFAPRMSMRLGSGIWALQSDSNGRLWAGGDIVSARSTVGDGRWTGGFVRFSPADASAPATPTNFRWTAQTADTVSLAWNAVPNANGVSYQVLRGDRPIATTTSTSITVPTSASERYFVRATDQAGNIGASTAVLNISGPVGDSTPPSQPTGLNVTGTTPTSVSLAWNPSTDAVGVTGYRIFRNGVDVGTSPTTSFTNTGLNPATAYSYRVAAYDAAGNQSFQSAPAVNVTTPNLPDTTAPSVPTGLAVTGTTVSSASLSWNASTDNTAVTGYRIFRNGVSVGTSTTTSFTNTGLAAATTYSYTVAAYDAATNQSAQSAPPVAATTPTQPVGGTLIPVGATWRYLDTGVDPGASWNSAAFNDAAWLSGAAELGSAEGDEVTVMNRVAFSHRVHYLRHTFNVANPAGISGLSLSLLVDDGAAVYLNGVELVRQNLPAGALTNTTNALVNVHQRNLETAYTTYTVPATALVAGTNLLAVSVHNAVNTAVSDVSFNLSLTAQ